MMRGTILLIIILCAIASSCRTAEENKEQAQQVAKQRLAEIDLTIPDQLPLFKDCDEMVNAADCFYEKLCAQVELKLVNHQLQFEITQRDSVTAILLVYKDGTISYKGLSTPAVNDKEIAVDSLLKTRLKDLVQIQPATKQGIPVNSSFLLPVVIKPATH